MVYLLAGAAETRSQETANHVRRVGLLAELLGRASGLDPALCEQLRYAAPLHDIGKIGIPDAILGKPGAHTPEEAAIMRTHAEIGAKLLGDSRLPKLPAITTRTGTAADIRLASGVTRYRSPGASRRWPMCSTRSAAAAATRIPGAATASAPSCSSSAAASSIRP
jgi:hypothetical protein